MIKLYTFHLSTNGRKVHMALEEAKAAYEIVVVNLMKGEQKNPDYLKLNPNGKVPTLVDDGVMMWESIAILLYLAEKFPAANLLPTAAADRARAFQWSVWQPTTFGAPASTLFRQMRFTPEDKRDQKVIEQARTEVTRNAEILASGLQGRDYLAGTFSVADMALMPYLQVLADLNTTLPPAVDAYYKRLAARPSWQKVLAYTG
ncbi:MAG TPA: glutathione S-transferase family protein [Candidatus Binatia bacterium]|nr:glutathione S-transferase family protein [Candidatus Binatia bacterium]